MALLLSSFSSDSLAAPEEETELNNLQIAVARIQKGIDYLKRKIYEFVQNICLHKSLTSTSGGQQNTMVPNHTVAGSNKTVDHHEDRTTTTICMDGIDPFSFINNPNLPVIVPIAVVESDFDPLNTEELSSISEIEDSKEVRHENSLHSYPVRFIRHFAH